MKAWIWLRVLAVLLAIFSIGHTLGTASPSVTRGPQEAALFAEMQGFRFPIMGFERSYWDFYRGFALIISIQLLAMMAIAWQLSAVSKQNPGQALPMAITLLIGCLGMMVLSWIFFFRAPIILSVMSVLCSAIVVLLLVRVRHNSHGPLRASRLET